MSELVSRTLLNRYRVDTFLGRGGMAEVYKAWDRRRSVYIAIKVLNEDLAEDYVFLRRFGREAQALELLQHPHIVRFFGFEESRGLAFLVMEYIDGVTLRRQLRLLDRSLTLPEALAVLQPVCSALHYAHTMGIYHCDVKPANIFIERGGRVVLGDFGIARLTESATVTFSTPGTPAYMSPEQCRAEDLDAQTDIYSLGITAYEMLTLDRPFKGETEETTGSRGERVRWEQMNLPPPQPRSVNPGISPAAEAAVLRALEKESERRQQAALEFYQDLSGTGAVQPASTVPWVVEPEAPSPVPPQPPPSPGPREERAGIRKALLALGVGAVVVGIVAVLICVATLALLLSRRGSTEAPALASLTGPPSTLTEPSPSETLPPGTPIPSTATPRTTNTPLPPTVLPSPSPVLPRAGDTRIRTSDGAVMAYVPAGYFWMGSTDADAMAVDFEKPQHRVYLDAFWIDRTEVAVGQYRACARVGVCSPPEEMSSVTRPNYFDGGTFDDYPVLWVNWYGADTYCRWVSARLPTEAEWERAARGTDGRIFPWGDAWDESRTNAVGRLGDTRPVGSFSGGASPYGVLDMSGNVWEWVADWFSDSYYASSPERNPQGPSSGSERCVRSGSWYSRIAWQRTANRGSAKPSLSDDDVGFRCVQDVVNP